MSLEKRLTELRKNAENNREENSGIGDFIVKTISKTLAIFLLAFIVYILFNESGLHDYLGLPSISYIHTVCLMTIHHIVFGR